MARKKRVKKRAVRKVSYKRSHSKAKVVHSPNKIQLVVNNLLLFVALCLVSLVFYKFVKSIILLNLFSVIAMISGFVAAAFLIALLILIIKKAIKG